MNKNDASLDTLVSVIEALQAIIRRDHTTIGTNETRTRNALIDPLLKALGWADSSVVTPEYLIRYGAGPADYGVVDYALHTPNNRANPIVLIEAKRMSEELTDAHREQALNYAIDKGESVRYWSLTNGDHWEFYEIWEDEVRLVFEISIRQDPAVLCAETLLSSFPIWSEQNRSLDWPKAQSSSSMPSRPSSTSGRALHSLSTGKANILKVLTWFGIACFLSTVTGYAFGFQIDEPAAGGYALVGMVALLATVIVVTVKARYHLISGFDGVTDILRLGGSYGLAGLDKQRTLSWLAISVLSGVLSGAALGYLGGQRTAQHVMNLLEGLGVLVVSAIIAVMILICVLALANSSARGRSRRSKKGLSFRSGNRPKRSYRRRR